MRSANKGDNADLKPLAIFKMLIYWNKQFSPRFSRVLDFSQRLNPGAAAVILFLLSTLLFYIFSRSRDPKRLSTVYAIATTGFFGMQVNLLLIFSYQVFYGILYQMIGLLTAVFMAGIATGALYIGKSSHNAKNPERLLLGLESFAVLFTLLLGIAVTSLSGQLEHFVGFFVLLFFLPGLLMGLEFVLAGIIYTDKNRGAGRVSGVLFASDLLGGWAAGVFGAIIFLPVLGFFDTCLITAMLKLSSLLLWALLGLRRSTPC
jgi:spermidine synthase